MRTVFFKKQFAMLLVLGLLFSCISPSLHADNETGVNIEENQTSRVLFEDRLLRNGIEPEMYKDIDLTKGNTDNDSITKIESISQSTEKNAVDITEEIKDGTDSNVAVQKIELKKDLLEMNEEIKSDELPPMKTESENVIENSLERRDIIDEELIMLERAYTDRFIVKYKNGFSNRNANLVNISKSAFEEALLRKSEKRLELKHLENEKDAAKYEQVKIIEPTNEVDNKEDVCIRKVNVEKHNYEIIQLTEVVEPYEFISRISEEIKDEIEYIQPDYKLELSGIDEISDTDLAVKLQGDTSFTQEESVIPQDESEPSQNENEYESEVSDEEETVEDVKLEETIPQIANIAVEETEIDINDIDANLSAAWQKSTGDGIIVAIIDTGIDISHMALSSNMISGWDFYNNTATVYNPELAMEQAHGTHIAGIIAKVAPNVKIMPIKVFENGVAYTSDIIEAIQYAESNGASIVNCSWGSTDNNQALREAMEQSNMTFVCAAGNNRLYSNEHF